MNDACNGKMISISLACELARQILNDNGEFEGGAIDFDGIRNNIGMFMYFGGSIPIPKESDKIWNSLSEFERFLEMKTKIIDYSKLVSSMLRKRADVIDARIAMLSENGK